VGVVIARPERPWQSPALERFEIAASAFGPLAMTPTNSILTDYYCSAAHTLADCQADLNAKHLGLAEDILHPGTPEH